MPLSMPAVTRFLTRRTTDQSPYHICREVTPHTPRLVGLKVIGGFKKAMHERIGYTEGCTHIVALIETMASVAIQALMGKRQGGSARLWPMHYRPRK